MTNIIRAIFVSAIIIMLSACGGGGGSAGNTSGSPLFTNAAEKITIAPGEIHKYQIGGGSSGYSASSSTSAVTVLINGNILTIAGVSGGSATVTVSDSSGAKVVIEATIGTGVDFYTTAPDELTVGVGVSSQAYLLGGGSRIYAVASSNRDVVTVTQNGSQFFITGISSGNATISATDTLGGNKKINVIVGSSIGLYTTAPSAVTVAVGSSSAIYSIGGGSQAYSVSSSDSSIATIGQSGKEFVITGKTGGKAVVIVKDTQGKEVKIDVVVGSADALYSTSASSIELAIGAANTYKVGGGSTLYSAGSSNPTVATAKIIGNDLTIEGLAIGVASIIVRDTTSGTLTITVTVGGGVPVPLFTTASSNTTVAPNTQPTFSINGGRAPYGVSSSNSSIVLASVAGNTLTLDGKSEGASSVVISDSVGATVIINVTVGAGVSIPLYTTAPSAISVVTDSIVSYVIGGGRAPFTATSSNVGVALISPSILSGNTFSIKGITAGIAQVVVRDSLGATVNINVTVSPVALTPLDVFPGDSSGSVGDTLLFTISGGSPFTAPSALFNILNNNPSIANVVQDQVNGRKFSAKLLNVGETRVTILDVQGQSKIIKLTATAASSLMRLSPNTITIGEDSISTISIQIFGGVAPYRAFTSDLTLSSVPFTVPGTTVDVGLGSLGTRCIRPVDASGTFQIGGTYEITLTVLDSLGATATAKMLIKDNSKGGLGCL